MTRSMFSVPAFRHPALGDFWGDLWSTATSLIKEAPSAYKAYTSKQTAEEQAEAAKAAAQAAQATAQAQTAQAQATSSQVAGIPTSYLVVGGLGLAALAVVLVIATK